VIDLILKAISTKEAILDGEIIAVGKGGSPLPFQHLMRRFRRVHKVDDKIEEIPVKLVLFDLLYFDGSSLINQSYSSRRKKLMELVNNNFIVEQRVISNLLNANSFLNSAIEKGHEGLVAKRLDSFYTPGIRGKSWFKIKTSLEPLDLVIVAAEYGYGRRHNWLSNYYLAAQNQQTGEFLIVGKTFKGLSDEEIIQMTKQLKELAIRMEGRRVIVQPKIIVEVTYNEIQDSPKYKSKMALRFARISRIRKDKSPQEVDTIEKLKSIYQNQFTKKARYKQNEHNN
jgi:DNA ligase-1